MSKKKIILMAAVVVFVLAIITGLIYFIGLRAETENKVLEGSTSKVSKLYSELKEKQAFSFTTTMDNKNATYYTKKDKTAYIETNNQGDKSKIIIKDGNSYLLLDDQEIYYTYKNNETDLEKIVVQLEEVQNKQYVEGKEKIDNKEYKYEEYEGTTGFLLKDVATTEGQIAKTRFYFNGEELLYIKTIVGDYQEILKVDISYNVDDKLFEIPSNYKEG